MVFCAMISPVYFDNAATTQVAPEVLEAMLPYLGNHFGNPSSLYGKGREARRAIERARRSVAQHFSLGPSSVIFTSGGTESNNAAMQAAIYGLGCQHIITSPIEHASVLRAVEFQSEARGIPVSYVRLLPDGHIDLDHLGELLGQIKEKCLVSLMHANNETGNITDLRAVGSLCRDFGAIFHSDCVLTIGHFPIDFSMIPIDLVSGSAHKFHGPKGSGLLLTTCPDKMVPFIHGGNQERGNRAGTENVAGIIGLSAALDRAMEEFLPEAAHICGIKKLLVTELENRFEDIQFNGDHKGASLYSILNVSFPEKPDSEPLIPFLDQGGFDVSGGSACSGGQSHVMEVLGKKNRINIRLSFSKNNSLREAILFLDRIMEWSEAPVPG